MKSRIVPADELSAKTLAPKDYIPGAFYNPEVLQVLRVRTSNNVLGEEDWPEADLYMKGGHVHQIRARRIGCSGLNIGIGQRLGDISHWTHYDPTGVHPEEFNEVFYKGVWESRLSVEQLMDAISWNARESKGSE